MKGYVQEFGRRLSVLQALGDDAEGKCLYAWDRLIPVGAVTHDAGPSGDLCRPATVVFAFQPHLETFSKRW